MASLRSSFLTFCTLLVLAPTAVLAHGASTQSCLPPSPAGFLSVMTSPGTSCLETTFVPSPTLFIVDVVMNAVPAQKVHFSLPDPPFGTIVGESWAVPAAGNIHTGIDLTIPGCTQNGLSVLGTILVSNPSGIINGCAEWKMNDGCQITDCEGVVRPATNWSVWYSNSQSCSGCFQQCQALPPYGLNPPDGAVDLPTTTQLSWTSMPATSLSDCSVLIGTDPDCASAQVISVPCSDHTFAPNFLQPGTTYYWRAGWFETGAGCNLGGVTPIRSFTTAGPLATEPATWGHVKSRYRQ
jgi:hypothetical protein